MMRAFILLAIAMMLAVSASSVSAAEIRNLSAEYDLTQDSAFVDVSISLKSNSSDFSWHIPKDAGQIEVPGMIYTVLDFNDYKDVQVVGNLSYVNIRYVTSSVVENTRDHFFILDLSGIKSDTKSVLVKLPEEATLKYSLNSSQASIIPATKDVITDGKRIILHWDQADFSKSAAILVIYDLPYTYAWLVYPIIIIVLVAVAGFLIYHYGFMRKYIRAARSVGVGLLQKGQDFGAKVIPVSHKRELTKNLFEEEKRIVEILYETAGHELWQKQLTLKSGLTKVAISRKLRSLEQKGLIEKIPYGNTNKIRLKNIQH
jgi:hypothetical protein